MVFLFTVLIALIVSNNILVDGVRLQSGQCSCPLKVDNEGVVRPGRCRGDFYKNITLVNVNRLTGADRCNRACEEEGNDCKGWSFRDDNITISVDDGNCRLYDSEPTRINRRRSDWVCYEKGTLLDTFSFLGDGLCQGGGSKYTQERAYSGPSDPMNDGKIESVEECKQFCMDNVAIDEYFFFEAPTSNKPGSACEGFNFITEKCGPADNLRDRCSTNCYLYAEAPTGNRTRASRRQNYDNYSCYVRDCSCD